MRIGLISTLATPVRQSGSGSVEALVWNLAHELIQLGHEVSVFATADSEVDGQLLGTLPGAYGRNGSPENWTVCEYINLGQAVKAAARFDVLHSQAYLYGMAVQELSRAPMLHTLHVAAHAESASLWKRFPHSPVTAISNYQWRAYPELQPRRVIYPGVDPRAFRWRGEAENYLCYLGRFIPEKGPLIAIKTARSLGLRLLLAGPRNEYFARHLEPLVDGKQVEYVGAVSGSRRDQLLGGARALLYPVQNPEPFGLVMVEAMMCGTPVAAIGIGAVPEVIDLDLTGYYSQTASDFSQAVVKALAIDRRRVREQSIARFSARRMALEYVEVYRELAENVDL